MHRDHVPFRPALLRLTALWLLLAAAFVAPAFAAAPRTMSYQGVLTDDAGVPLPDAAYSLTFRIHTALVGGSVLWTETHPSVVLAKGDNIHADFVRENGNLVVFGNGAFRFANMFNTETRLVNDPWGEERRAAARTLEAYQRDVEQFLRFLTVHLGGPPSLGEIGRLRTADVRAFLAATVSIESY